ncbi:hypothetical protein Poly51_62750 [Rubripirellula tenax]|uniref:Knr4/Smi1-like domain-containing protein n=1 Tax=Rubripirellula tenax TaxID=2528015 RepID=A0A5C6E479_9BACT|nr:SMI1/KNR4 family protein [Rubripirellula tenax]TWU43620.1 hypothetical protein Poly51_62750 [Rubripirellula tenax]
MFDKLKSIRELSEKSYFSAVDAAEITLVEHRMGIVFPESLKALWREFGYFGLDKGLKDSEPSNQFNRLLTPIEIEGLVSTREDVGFSSPSDERIENAIPFMAYSEGGCFQLMLDDSAVYYFDDVVGSCLEEFIDKLSQHADFYRD